jgi:copper oxidase (laccase) domain-containing protein
MCWALCRTGFWGGAGRVGGRGGGAECRPGSADDPAAVAENRRRAAHAVLPGARLATCYQIHSALCVEAQEWADDARPHADALVSNRAGIVLGVLTADCAPVLFADAKRALWAPPMPDGRAHLRVFARLRLMRWWPLARGAKIAAAIGPCIAQISYEVDEGFRTRFLDQNAAHERFFAAGRRALSVRSGSLCG